MRSRLIVLVIALIAVVLLARGTSGSPLRLTSSVDDMTRRGRLESKTAAVSARTAASPTFVPVAASANSNAYEQRSAPSAVPTTTALAAVVVRRIRSAQLEILVDSVSRAFRMADTIVGTLGGVVADAQQSQDVHAVHDGRWTIRVPETQFDASIARFRRLGNVKNEVISSQDITREYADLETRLAVKQETVDRLRALLAARTAKLSDVLQVERELARTITELEQLEGERRMDDDLVAMASVSVHVFEHEPAPTTIATGVGTMLQSSLATLGDSFSTLLDLAMLVLPWLAVASVLWFVARRRVRVPSAM